MKIGFLVAFFLLVNGAIAQSRVITGQITDATDASAIPGVNVLLKGTLNAVVADKTGSYSITIPSGKGVLVFSFIGFKKEEVTIGISNVINISLVRSELELSEVAVIGSLQGKIAGVSVTRSPKRRDSFSKPFYSTQPTQQQPSYNTEEYDGITENGFHEALKTPLSTFSIDVDAASYSNVRRFINNGELPPADAVRIEEMVNYFDYDYEQPKGDDPFSIYTEVGAAPWNPQHKLVHIGLQGKRIPTENLPASNLVFLIDVSGSMSDPNKLPLLKASFRLLVSQLRAQDRVAMVVYAGAAGLVLPSTPGDQKEKILSALDQLSAGGSTAGGAGLQLAYSVAKQNLQENGSNRVILATDGDFNVGESSNQAMENLIKEKREDGIFLTVLGYGMGNYKDSKMETLADKGNGNYAYIDNVLEAQKVLVNEFGGTLFTIAKDVKLQIEFNPAKVKAYRLIGYENRLLKDEDFNNDKKDAGELGSGHTVTALYEVIPVGVKSSSFSVDDLKYQGTKPDEKVNYSDELMTVKFRYKKPKENTSSLIVHVLKDSSAPQQSDNFKWSAAVASFGMLLRNSEYVMNFTYNDVLKLATESRGIDKEGYRIEFIRMIKSRELLAKR